MAIKKEGGIVMKNLVVLTGAGMSAESGISTFRDAGGICLSERENSVDSR